MIMMRKEPVYKVCSRCKAEVAMFNCPKGLCAGCLSYFEVRSTIHNICKWAYYCGLVVIPIGAIMGNATVICVAIIVEICTALLGWHTRDD